MIALLALSAVWSMGTGAVHLEPPAGSPSDGRPVGRAEPTGLAEPEAPPRCGDVLACGAEAWCCSSVNAPAVPPMASTTSASVRVSERARRRPGRAGTGGPPRSPYGGRLASTSAWASRHGSGRPSAVRTAWELAGPAAGLNDISGSSIGRVLVTPRGEPAGSARPTGWVPGPLASFRLRLATSDASLEDGTAAAGTSGTGWPGAGPSTVGPSRTGMSDTGMSDTGMLGTDPKKPGSAGPGSTGPAEPGPGDPGPGASANSAGPGPTGAGIGGPGPARSAWSPRMKSVKEPLL